MCADEQARETADPSQFVAVFLPGVPRELWPIHVRPYPDELLTSWVIRFAHAHGYRSETACALALGREHAFWCRDSDRSASLEKLAKLAQASGLDVQTLEGLTLRPWGGFLSESVKIDTGSPGILPAGIYHRKRRRCGLMVCPACLRLDDTPYYRRNWRLAFLAVCPEHEVLLLDRCEACSEPIAPYRVDMKWVMRTSNGGNLHVLCHGCGHDLRQSRFVSVEQSEVAFARLIAGTLNTGYVQLSMGMMLHSVAFFKGIRVLLGCVRLASMRGHLSAHQARRRNCRCRWGDFEMMEINERREGLSQVAALLEEWPGRFLAFAAKHHITFTDMLSIGRTGRELPYWLWSIARWHLRRG